MEDVSKKRDEGITLIALIITIIVLLILAGVTINLSIGERGIFTTAQRAAKETKEASKKEETALSRYEFEVEKALGNVDETQTYGEYLMEQEIKAKYGVDIKIGDTVNYDPNLVDDSYNGTWRVLGIEDGKILLMSSKPVGDSIKEKGIDGYINAVERLDGMCEKYGTGVGAESARSLRVEDINRITGYDPDNPVDCEKYGSDTIYEYGERVTLKKLGDGKVTCVGSNGATYSFEDFNEKYVNDEGEEVDLPESYTLTNTMYAYSIDNR